MILLPTALVEPVSLPISSVPLPRDNEEGLVVGFNNINQNGEPSENSVLQGVYLQTIAMNRCGSTHIINPLQNTFCASDPWYQSNSCSGNVGSGFVVRTRGEDLLVIKIESFMNHCGLMRICLRLGWNSEHIQSVVPQRRCNYLHSHTVLLAVDSCCYWRRFVNLFLQQ